MGPSSRGEPLESIAARVVQRLRDASVSGSWLHETSVDELAFEARPIVEALLEATRSADEGHLGSVEHHETRAMVSLLGRRLALLGGTPTTACDLIHTMLDAIRSSGWSLPEGLELPLTAIALEGFVLGREEAWRSKAGKEAAEHIAVATFAPGCVLVTLAGAFPPEIIDGVMEEVGRRLFREDAAACLVALEGLAPPSPELARAIASLASHATTLGVEVVFAGGGAPFRVALEHAGIRLDDSSLVDNVEEGFERVLSSGGHTLWRSRWWRAPFRAIARYSRG